MQFSMDPSRGAWKPDGTDATKDVNRMKKGAFDCKQCGSPDTCERTASAAGHHDQLAAHIDHLLEESWTLPQHKHLIWNRHRLHTVDPDFRENLHLETFSLLN